MRLKISVTVDAEHSGNNSEEEVKRMLVLAQGGMIMKYVDRLVSAGSMPLSTFVPGVAATTYIELRDE